MSCSTLAAPPPNSTMLRVGSIAAGINFAPVMSTSGLQFSSCVNPNAAAGIEFVAVPCPLSTTFTLLVYTPLFPLPGLAHSLLAMSPAG